MVSVPVTRNGGPNYLVSLDAPLTAAAALGTFKIGQLELSCPEGGAVAPLLFPASRSIVWLRNSGISRSSLRHGFFCSAASAGLFRVIVIALSSPLLLFYPHTFVELLILAPGSAVVLGYLYLRTENILSCTLLHGLLLSHFALIIF